MRQKEWGVRNLQEVGREGRERVERGGVEVEGWRGGVRRGVERGEEVRED